MDESLINAPTPATEKQVLECKKLTVEIEKITLEKKELEKKWLKFLQYTSYVLPSVLGIGALLTALFTGYLNKASLANKNENILIQLQTKELEAKKVLLNHQSDSLAQVVVNAKVNFQVEKKRLADSINHLQGEIFFYKNDLARLENGFASENEKINTLQKILANLYADNKQLILRNDSLRNNLHDVSAMSRLYLDDFNNQRRLAEYSNGLIRKLQDSINLLRKEKL